MNPDTITETFTAFISKRGLTSDRITPPVALELMRDFYDEVKFEWVANDSDSDMLLFQYGVYNGRKENYFDLNITRQLICEPGDDENMFQLALTLFYKTEGFTDISSFNKWSMASASFAEYLTDIKNTEGYRRACDNKAYKVEIFTDTV